MIAEIITADRLEQLAGHAAARALAPLLNAAASKYDISSPLRIAHWLAQAAFESQGFTRLEEDLDYTVADIMRVWPARFPTPASAQRLAHNPLGLANEVYGERMGNTEPGDPFRYRGRGLFQLTGRDAYLQAGRISGEPFLEHPELVTSSLAGEAAGAFWRWKDINPFADHDDLEGVTRRVNGGLVGLTERAQWLKRAKAIWAVKPPADPAPRPPTAAASLEVDL